VKKDDQVSQPHAPDPVLDADIVLGLARRHVPGALSVTAVDESGGEARAYALDGGPGHGPLILKTQRPHRIRPRTSLEKEACFLRHLESARQGAPLPVPRVLGYGKELTTQGLVEYICMTRIPGIAARQAKVSGQERVGMLKGLGAVLWDVHHVDQAALIQSGLFPGDRTEADFLHRLETGFDSALTGLLASGTSWPGPMPLMEVVSIALKALPKDGRRSLVVLHSNPGETHTFADPPKRSFTGLIDFGDAYVSHPAFDLVRWREPSDREAVLQGYLSSGDAGEYGRFMETWKVVCILADLQHAAWNPDTMSQAAAQISRMLEKRR
jgi:aminoglycoside phosphotransferase (APT) family kinase protein